MNKTLWIVQVWLALSFLFQGFIKFSPPPPDMLPALFQWLHDMPPGLSIFVGVAELLAAAGLILPGLTKIQTRLTPLAALGLMVLMAGAIVFHIPRGEFVMIGGNIFLFALTAFVAYGRWRLSPLKDSPPQSRHVLQP